MLFFFVIEFVILSHKFVIDFNVLQKTGIFRDTD